MPFIGNKPSAVPLTSADITDGIITSAKIADGTIVNTDINATAGVVFTKLASTGTLTLDNIQFPATAVPSADANNLDDYEEGTWTPSLGGNTTYTSRSGYYRKVGSLVFVHFSIHVNLIGTGSSSVVQGFPFTSTGVGQPINIAYYADIATTSTFVNVRIDSSSTQAVTTSTAGNTITMNNLPAIFGNAALFFASGFYITS